MNIDDLLATPTNDGQVFGEILPWLLLLLGAVIVGGIFIYIARRMTQGGEDASNVGFTLHDLRELHARGELTDEEFERARAQMIAKVKSAADNDDAESADDDAHVAGEDSDNESDEPTEPRNEHRPADR